MGGSLIAANNYGFSIYFKTNVPMASSPIFTHYSNIPGRQSTSQYEDMGDGWYKAKVVWYDTITRNDSKYRAINPLSATLNVPITVYRAGPFRENENRNYVSQYTNSTRSVTGALIDMTKNNIADVSNMSYDSNAQMYFDGINDYMAISSGNLSEVFSGTKNWTIAQRVNYQ